MKSSVVKQVLIIIQISMLSILLLTMLPIQIIILIIHHNNYTSCNHQIIPICNNFKLILVSSSNKCNYCNNLLLVILLGLLKRDTQYIWINLNKRKLKLLIQQNLILILLILCKSFKKLKFLKNILWTILCKLIIILNQSIY